MPTGSTEVGLGPGHIVLDGDPAPPQKGPHCVRRWPSHPRGHRPQLSAYVSCGKRLYGSRCHLVRR